MNIPTLSFANGDRIPALGLGTWKAEPGAIGEAIPEAIRMGYRHFDCAAIYENEAEIGEAFARAFRDGLVTRDELWITSKLWNNRHLKDDAMPGLKQTLADLRLDYLDLYLVHWPIALKRDVGFPEKGGDFLGPEEAPLEDTWEAMEEMADAGLCRHIGVSNFSPERMRRFVRDARRAPEVNQVECHPLLAQPDLLAACRECDVLLTAYSPLGSPGAAGKDAELSVLQNPDVRAVADKHDATPAQVALAWAIARGTIAIPKSVNPERQRENLGAAELTLDAGDMGRLDSLDRGHRFINGAIWAMDGSPYTLEWLWEG
jgi:alcohol dehydrogenase (NADP+)